MQKILRKLLLIIHTVHQNSQEKQQFNMKKRVRKKKHPSCPKLFLEFKKCPCYLTYNALVAMEINSCQSCLTVTCAGLHTVSQNRKSNMQSSKGGYSAINFILQKSKLTPQLECQLIYVMDTQRRTFFVRPKLNLKKVSANDCRIQMSFI